MAVTDTPTPARASAELRVVARGHDWACVSDKPVDQVVGYAVRFDDGGWANAIPRRYGGPAQGLVFFVATPDEGIAARAARCSRYDYEDVVRLDVRGSATDVIVDAVSDGEAAVEIHGSRAFCDAVKVEEVAGDVRLRWFEGDIPEPDPGSPRLVRCSAPSGAELVIDAHDHGRWWINGRVRRFVASVGGRTELFCDSAVDVDLEVHDDASAFIANAFGRVRVRADDCGSAVIPSGSIDELDAVVRGSASALVAAPVTNARVSNAGAGAAIVTGATRSVAYEQRGAGPVVVTTSPVAAAHAAPGAGASGQWRTGGS